MLCAFVLGSISMGFAWAGNPAQGAKIYQQHCVNCHGQQGQPLVPGTPDLGKGASLAKPDQVLQKVIESGSKLMPAYLGILQDNDIKDVISYIRTFL